MAPLLAIDDLHAGYGEVLALQGVSLQVPASRIVTLLGANGAGKTTLLKTLSGIVRPRSGALRLDGEAIGTLAPSAIVARGVGHVPEGREVFPHLSVDDHLRMGAYLRRDRDAVARDRERCYALFPALRGREHDHAGVLSGGLQQMLAIARALMGRPRLLLLDEPSLGLAPVLAKDVSELIRRLNGEEGLTVLLVEQNANLALRIADHGYVLETGRIRLEGSAAALRNEPLVHELYLGSRAAPAVRG